MLVIGAQTCQQILVTKSEGKRVIGRRKYNEVTIMTVKKQNGKLWEQSGCRLFET
jgi:hypothetical protein